MLVNEADWFLPLKYPLINFAMSTCGLLMLKSRVEHVELMRDGCKAAKVGAELRSSGLPFPGHFTSGADALAPAFFCLSAPSRSILHLSPELAG